VDEQAGKSEEEHLPSDDQQPSSEGGAPPRSPLDRYYPLLALITVLFVIVGTIIDVVILR
jgi:hypothetical protein